MNYEVIEASKELPTEEGKYFVFTEHTFMHIAKFNPAKGGHSAYFVTLDNGYLYPNDVRAGMIIPKIHKIQWLKPVK